MTRRKDLPPGTAYCSHGRHIAPIGEFYVREGGKLSSWCRDCTAAEAKQSKGRKQMVELLVAKMVDQEEERPKDIEEQTIIHSHTFTGYGLPLPDALEFPPAKLDWLTPIWGFEERISGNVDD